MRRRRSTARLRTRRDLRYAGQTRRRTACGRHGQRCWNVRKATVVILQVTLLEKSQKPSGMRQMGALTAAECELRGSERRRFSNDCAGCCGRDVESGSRSGGVLLVGGVGTGSSSSEMLNAGCFEDTGSNAGVIGRSVGWFRSRSFGVGACVSFHATFCNGARQVRRWLKQESLFRAEALVAGEPGAGSCILIWCGTEQEAEGAFAVCSVAAGM